MSTRPFIPAVRVLVALCAFSAISFAQKTQPSPAPHTTAPAPFIKMATAIGDDYFDGRDSRQRVRRHLDIARQAGVGYLRFGFSWNGVEPEQGKYRFEFWDMLVEEAARAKIELIPYVAYTPEWAARSEHDFWKQPPKNPELFAGIMRTLARRYRGKIRTWELWNEPDNLEYWTGTPDEFAATMIAGVRAVREVAPETRLVLGGMTQGAGDFFQKLVREHHLDRYFDVLAVHAYPESWHEQRAEAVFHQILPEMEKAAQNSGRALWLNEMGYADYRFAPNKASLYGTSTFYNYEHTARYSADFLFKSYAMALASGDVSLAGWYRIDDFVETDPRMPSDKVHHHLGVTDVSGKPKPAFHALKFFNTLFASPARIICSPQGPAPCSIQQGAPAPAPETDATPGSDLAPTSNVAPASDVAPGSDGAPASRRLSRGRPALAKPRFPDSNTAPTNQPATATSQAVVNLFQRADSTLVVTAWLRSSTYSEVAMHTGMEPDRRRERVNLQLPCTAKTVRTFNALGKPLSTQHPNSSTLHDVTLTGERVFIAEVSCAPGTEASKAATPIKAD